MRLLNMGKTEQIAGLGLVAAGTYMERKEDKDDRDHAAQIQGSGYGPVPSFPT
jgi:hypothetical protein